MDNGGGGDAGLGAHVSETDWGLEVGMEDSCTGLRIGGAGVEKKDIGVEKNPADEGGPLPWGV